MVTATSDILKGLALWAVAMVAPVLMAYIDNTTFRLVFLTLMYPTILSFLCRAGHFWVSHSVVMIASVVTFLIALLIQMNDKAKDSIKNPDQNRLAAGLFLGALLFVFLVTMFGASRMIDMYNTGEFNAADPY